MILGAIADDVTGATDLASVIRRAGLRVVQTLDQGARSGGTRGRPHQVPAEDQVADLVRVFGGA